MTHFERILRAIAGVVARLERQSSPKVPETETGGANAA
jgi:hypothetical protein